MTECFGSRIVGVAHGLGVLDHTDIAELIDGILADFETAKDGVGRNRWRARQQRRAWVSGWLLWNSVIDVKSFWLSSMSLV